MNSIGVKHATNPGDPVFGYLGCFSPEIRSCYILVDSAASPSDVCIAATQLAIEEPGLDIITRALLNYSPSESSVGKKGKITASMAIRGKLQGFFPSIQTLIYRRG